MEARELNELTIAEHIKSILRILNQPVASEGLVDTPRRWARYMMEFLQPKVFKFTKFKENVSEGMVVESNISFSSLCCHHLLQFSGFATIGYLPNKWEAGLSKLPRTLDFFAHRLQTQENLTNEVAKFLNQELQPKGVGVILRASHSCMSHRGVKKSDVWTTTTALLGAFKKDSATRQEFLSYR